MHLPSLDDLADHVMLLSVSEYLSGFFDIDFTLAKTPRYQATFS